MDILIKATQLILSLSIFVLLHELGHFIPAKLFKTRVERFFLFFDPWFALFKKKIGGTLYGIGWLPLGGYVKISGMIDENFDKSYKNRPSQPWEFRSKPAWQRLIIMLGGIIVNTLLAIVIFSGLFFHYGETYLPTKNMKYGIAVDIVGRQLGLENGDSIQYVDGKYIENFRDLPTAILLGKEITLDRMGKTITLPLDDKKKSILFDRKELGLFISPRVPTIVKNVVKNSGADKAGLKVEDEILAINSEPVFFTDQIHEILSQKKENTVILSINRGGELFEKTAHMDKHGKLGIDLSNLRDMRSIFKMEKKHYSLAESIPAGATKTWKSLMIQVDFFKQIFNTDTKAYKQVGSIFSMAKVFSPQWNWELFWGFTANLSVWLAFLNLLPIPSLDGGYVLFTVVEMITGKKIGEKFLEKAITVGFIFIALLMIVVLSWDTFKNFIN
ncbi:MAG: RIP metalloprotease RseP [Flavobacteriales bacterium Tduv]